MQWVLLACVPGALTLSWFFGWGTLLQLLLGLATALACEALVRRLRGLPVQLLGDGSALVSATLLALSLPPYAPWWLAVSAGVFAHLFGKALFGGFGKNPFNPAMLGYVFALLAFPAQMNHWPAPGGGQGLMAGLQQVFGTPDSVDGWSQATLLDSLKHNDRLTVDELFQRNPAFSHWSAAWVNLAFLLGGLLLLQRGVIRWHTPVGVLGGLFVASLLCWNGSGSDSNGSPVLHLFSGATMLGAFFIATEPVSGPDSDRARLLFGIGVGLWLYVIRTWGGYADGVAFAVLAMNLLVPLLERHAARRVGKVAHE
jgi:electron transport complex protein RnfD